MIDATWFGSPARIAQVAETLTTEAQRYATLAADARTQAATYRKAAKGYADVDAALAATHAAQADEYKQSASYFQRIANANARGLEQWEAGIRPQLLASGGWMLPSKSDGCPHIITKDGGWICCCAARDQAHWATAILEAIESVGDDEDRYDDDGMDAVNNLIADAIEAGLAQPSEYELARESLNELFN